MISPNALAAFSPDDPIQRTYDSAKLRSQDGQFDNLPKRARFYVRHQLARIAIGRAPGLDIAECGCWRGHSTLMIADVARELGCRGRFSVFDSFEGLSDFVEADLVGQEHLDADAIISRRVHFRSDEDHVRRITEPYGFVDVYPGWIPDRFPEVDGRSFSFIHVDVDLHEPTRQAADFFYPRLVDGGVMFFDDYGYNDFPGAKMSVDEFLASVRPPEMFIVLPVGSAFLIK